MKPPDRYTKFREKVPQKAGTYTYTKSMWEPPRDKNLTKMTNNFRDRSN